MKGDGKAHKIANGSLKCKVKDGSASKSKCQNTNHISYHHLFIDEVNLQVKYKLTKVEIQQNVWRAEAIVHFHPLKFVTVPNPPSSTIQNDV